MQPALVSEPRPAQPVRLDSRGFPVAEKPRRRDEIREGGDLTVEDDLADVPALARPFVAAVCQARDGMRARRG